MPKQGKPARWCTECGELTDHFTASHGDQLVQQKPEPPTPKVTVTAVKKHIHHWEETPWGEMFCQSCNQFKTYKKPF